MSSKPTISFQEWSQEIASKTDLMLKELRERLDKSHSKAITEESFWQLNPPDSPFEWLNDFVREQWRKAVRHCYCQNDVLATLEAFNYYNKINNEKEKEKMDAKRCDRCGKLYGTEEGQNYISSYMPGRYVSEYEKENHTDARIREDHTSSIRIIYYGNNANVDLCPECRKKLKNFFESGKDDPMDVAVREINTVIKKAEEN